MVGLVGRAGLLCLVVGLSGCQNMASNSIADGPLSDSVPVREAALSKLNNFRFSGGLGIWTDEQSIPARVQWQQAGDVFTLMLSGPMGLGDMQLEQSDGQSTLTRGNTVVASGASADRVIQQGLGLSAPVPVEQLKLWVRGLPGEAKSVKRDAQGKLASLRFQDATGTGWQTRFKSYTEFNGLEVPSLITASGGRYSVRLVLKKWQMSATSVVPESKESNKRLPIPRR